MSKPPLFFIVIIGLIVVAASFRFMQQRREKADNDMAPLQQKLVVSNKREKPINDRRSRQQEVTPAGTSIRYEASFKPQSGGMEQTFRLDAQQYHALTVGDKGTLSYKGTRFVSFVGEQ
ncbi:Receptor [Escherichia coli]